MRESLTFFAVAVILVLSALLVGPYFVDWNGQRDWLAAKLSEAVGARVRIAGPVDVKLLPRPIFRAGSVSMEGATPQDPTLAAERLDAELSINGLLQGAIQFVDARVSAPRLRVTLRDDGSIVAPAWDVRNPQKFQFSHVIVSDGTVAVRDERGADRLVVTGIEAQGEADTLFGPIKLGGTAAGPAGALTFRLTTGAFAGGKLRGRLVVDTAGTLTHADADGTIAVVPSAVPGHPTLSFLGDVNAAGSLHVADGAAPVPWRVAAAAVTADARGLTVPAVELRAGIDGRALVANGAGLLAFGGAPSLSVQLRARQLDLDRIAVAPDVAPDTPRPGAAQWLAALQALATEGGSLPMGVAIDAGIDAVTTNDLTFTSAAASVKTQPGTPPRVTASIAGPNGSRLALDGTIPAGPVAAFSGRASAETRDLARASRWIEPFLPGTADWVAANAPIESLGFDAQVQASKVGLSARDMRLTLDGSSFKGLLSLTTGVGEARPRLLAELSADTLDLDRLPEFGALGAAAGPLDLSLGIAAETVKVSRIGSRPIDTGRLAFHVTKSAEAVTLDQFSVADFEGATVTATATLDAARNLSGEGHAAAKTIGPLAGLMQRLMPGAVADALAARADVLSPMQLDFKLDGTLGEEGVTPRRATGTGSAGGTRFTVAIAPETAAAASDAPATAHVVLDAPEGSALLRQLGWPASTAALGAGHLDLTAKGTPQSGYDTHAAATLAGSTWAFDGFVGPGSGRGHVVANGGDAVPLVKAAGWVGPPGAPVWPWTAEGDAAWGDGKFSVDKLRSRIAGVAVAGSLGYVYGAANASAVADQAPAPPALTGALTVESFALTDLAGLALPTAAAAKPSEAWSTAKFAGVPAWPRAALALRFGTLALLPGVVARDAALTLTLAPASLTIGDFAGHLMDGTAGGTVTLRRDGPSASLSGQVRFDALALALPSLAGRLSGALSLAGTGSSPDALVGSLAGEGSLSVAGATIPRFDPGALARVAVAFNQEGATIDDGTVKDALFKALDRGALGLGDVATPAIVAGGTLRIVGLQVGRPDFTVAGESAFNLRTRALALKVTLAAAALPKDWKGDPPQVTVTWSGPMGAPERAVDAAAFVNGLAARAIARDQERIELMQDDLRERAFFARRLRAIEAEQQAARDAAQAKIVPLPPTRTPDIRLPKPPDVAAPVIKPSVAPATGDDLTSFLERLGAPAKPKAPFDLAPATKPGPPAGATPSTADPGKAGRY